MTISVTTKSRTISNGDSGDATPVETNFVELYNNDATLATAHNAVLGTTTTNSAVDGLYLILRNAFAASPGPTDHGGLEFERGSATNVRLRWNETNDWWEITHDGSIYHPVSLVSSADPGSPVEGDVWYNSTSHVLKYRDNSATRTVSISSVSALDDLSDVTITTPSSGDFLRYNGSAWVDYTPYVSTGQTITSGGLLTLAHSLGAAPNWVTAYLKCTDAGGDGGWEQNDQLFINIGNDIRSTSTPHGLAITRDVTNLIIRFASDSNVFFILNEGDGTGSNLTNTKWQLFLIAGL